jgi:hypothetical protein
MVSINVTWILSKLFFFIIGSILTFIYKDTIKKKFYKVIIWLSNLFGSSDSHIRGEWKATFKYPKRDYMSEDTSCDSDGLVTIDEIIKIYQFSNYIVGEIIPSYSNSHDRNVEKDTLRITGKFIKGTTHITGSWFHPSEKQDFHGAFQLDVSPSNQEMEGRWIGFNSSREVECNKWIWKKIES